MKKMTIGDILNSYSEMLNKTAFIPAPNSSAGQAMMQQQAPQAGQADMPGQAPNPQNPGGDDGSGGQAPPMAANGIEDDGTGIEGVPGGDPTQGGGDPSGQGGGSSGHSGHGHHKHKDPGQDQGEAAKGVDGRGDAAPTDLDSTTVTLRLRDVLDLVSGGKATQSALKIQDLLNKQQLKNEQQSRQQAMKEQQEQMKMQQMQQQGMAGQGGMMDSSGIYGNANLGGQGGGADPSQMGGMGQ